MKASDWQVLQTAPLFRAMPAEAVRGLAGNKSECFMKRGTAIFQQGMRADYFYVILEGWIKLFRLTPAGGEAVVGVFHTGETIGEAATFLGDPYPVSAEAATDCRLLMIDGENFKQRILKDPDFGLVILASVSRHLKYLVEHIEQMKVLDAPRRIADFLLRMSGTAGGPYVVPLPYEKFLIARRLGMMPESFSRAMAKLRPLGVTMDRGHVTIADVKLLQRYVETQQDEAEL